MTELANLYRTETKLKDKLLSLNYHQNKLEYYKEVLKQKNETVGKLKSEISKRSMEIHLPYTYKKRFNQIVKDNQTGSNYPRARTNARQEVTIGNVLDYLDRAVDEKNTLKQEIKMIKKEKKKISNNFKLQSNRSNPRPLQGGSKLSDAGDSDLSVDNFAKKTFDNSSSKPKKVSNVMLQGKSNIKYKKLLDKSKSKKLKQISTTENFITEDTAHQIMNSF